MENGCCVADEEGSNVWVETDEPTNYSCLLLKKSFKEMAQIIYSLKIKENE